MSKKIIMAGIVMLSLTGCANSKDDTCLPGEIRVGSSTMEYNQSLDNVDAEIRKMITVAKSPIGLNDSNSINVITDTNNTVRYISINKPEIYTLFDLSVGESRQKIKDLFTYEKEMGSNIYYVLFDGEKEIDPMVEEKEDSWIGLTYQFDANDKLAQISIGDVRYNKTLQ